MAVLQSEVLKLGSPEYFEKFGVPASPDDLMRHRCLIDESGYWWFGEDTKAIKVKVNGYLSGNRGSLLLRYALKGLGITQQSNHPMCNLVRQKKLLAVPGGWSRWSVTWYALSRTRTSTVPKIQVLIEFLKERFAQPDKINSF